MQLATCKLFCSLIYLSTLWMNNVAVVTQKRPFRDSLETYHHPRRRGITGHKASFTQKGYIQFLKYFTHVPPLTDYTFCIWMRSENLTYAHPLLSYSKNEKERLIRVWVTPFGTSLNLELLGYPVFTIPVHLREHRWYHICQSWSNRAAWTLHLNGKLRSTGFEPRLRGAKIKGGGDIVVGQEYTDFDRGLDDGIEGDVFGFNFVRSPVSVDSASTSYEDHTFRFNRRINDVSDVFGYLPIDPNRKTKGVIVFPHHKFRAAGKDTVFPSKSTGLKLVELSYNCVLGKGAPLRGNDVVVSWTETPVRVFGGAIIKNAELFCTNPSYQG